MFRCPNCGRKTSGDSCRWCKYPILKGTPTRPRYAEKQAKKQAEREAREKAKQKVEEVKKAREADRQAQKEAEIEAREKARQDAEEARIAREVEEKARIEAQIAASEEESAAAADLLRFCALLDPDAIPEELFVDGANELGENLERLAESPDDLHEIVGRVTRYSLVTRDPGEKTLSIHRLVQEVIRDGMSEEEIGWSLC